MVGKWHKPENEDRLRKAVAESTSIAGTCRNLGLKGSGGNPANIKHHIVRLGIDTSHHLGQAWNRDNFKEPTNRTHKVAWKSYLIRVHGYRCWECGLSEWMGKPMPLEIDHINGVSNDNRENNLRILCSNCHAQTPTFRNRKRDADVIDSLVKGSGVINNLNTSVYCVLCRYPCQTDEYWHDYCNRCCDCGVPTRRLRCGVCGTGTESPTRKNKSKRSGRPRVKRPPKFCLCGKQISSTATRCKSCAVRSRGTKINWPPVNELLDMLSKSNYTRVGKQLGVSDNAIRKHLKRHQN